uniref:Transmembrane protein n=1 Tax=Chromera velia CCMP2878 TaxID=1169474 RepID=A0A0G4HHS7_9ALVE|eukprot:Cvel_6855.t1-p1 / transcript=Cvel_6855.t1 / gene=Cvel_6855 / organism=Chromera_velia_CCMP2878 / gene_product=hypothetical protein / transcript_product=hypothetical protein / location=Cvel_scaffold346:6445-10145(+) / protein_length=904 / sequence_SO=supercontig / SO=protein_coding / is_pseudo=false
MQILQSVSVLCLWGAFISSWVVCHAVGHSFQLEEDPLGIGDVFEQRPWIEALEFELGTPRGEFGAQERHTNDDVLLSSPDSPFAGFVSAFPDHYDLSPVDRSASIELEEGPEGTSSSFDGEREEVDGDAAGPVQHSSEPSKKTPTEVCLAVGADTSSSTDKTKLQIRMTGDRIDQQSASVLTAQRAPCVLSPLASEVLFFASSPSSRGKGEGRTQTKKWGAEKRRLCRSAQSSTRGILRRLCLPRNSPDSPRSEPSLHFSLDLQVPSESEWDLGAVEDSSDLLSALGGESLRGRSVCLYAPGPGDAGGSFPSLSTEGIEILSSSALADSLLMLLVEKVHTESENEVCLPVGQDRERGEVDHRLKGSTKRERRSPGRKDSMGLTESTLRRPRSTALSTIRSAPPNKKDSNTRRKRISPHTQKQQDAGRAIDTATPTPPPQNPTASLNEEKSEGEEENRTEEGNLSKRFADWKKSTLVCAGAALLLVLIFVALLFSDYLDDIFDFFAFPFETPKPSHHVDPPQVSSLSGNTERRRECKKELKKRQRQSNKSSSSSSKRTTTTAGGTQRAKGVLCLQAQEKAWAETEERGNNCFFPLVSVFGLTSSISPSTPTTAPSPPAHKIKTKGSIQETATLSERPAWLGTSLFSDSALLRRKKERAARGGKARDHHRNFESKFRREKSVTRSVTPSISSPNSFRKVVTFIFFCRNRRQTAETSRSVSSVHREPRERQVKEREDLGQGYRVLGSNLEASSAVLSPPFSDALSQGTSVSRFASASVEVSVAPRVFSPLSAEETVKCTIETEPLPPPRIISKSSESSRLCPGSFLDEGYGDRLSSAHLFGTVKNAGGPFAHSAGRCSLVSVETFLDCSSAQGGVKNLKEGEKEETHQTHQPAREASAFPCSAFYSS